MKVQNGNQCGQTMGSQENNRTENQARTRLCNILETTVRNLHYLCLAWEAVRGFKASKGYVPSGLLLWIMCWVCVWRAGKCRISLSVR